MSAVVCNVKNAHIAVRNAAALSSSARDKDITFYKTETGFAKPLPDALSANDPRFPMPGNTGIDLSILPEDDGVPVRTLAMTILGDTESEELRKHDVIDQYVQDMQQQIAFDDTISELIASVKIKEESSDVALEQGVKESPVPGTVEWSVQQCPSFLHRDFMELFPDIKVKSGDLTMVNLCQKTQHDMSGWSESVGEERDQLGKVFMDCASDICSTLRENGFWADFIDPGTGSPFFGAYTNTTLFETDERYNHFGFNILDLGCCKVISHKLWGTYVFVGSIFTNAPANSELLTRYCQDAV